MSTHRSAAIFGAACVLALNSVAALALTSVEQLGKDVFFDQSLSYKENQSCASCHGPAYGWTGPLEEINLGGAVYEGSLGAVFGNRKPPSAAYATLSPIFHMDKSGLFVGGNFWDGRATGEKLGNPAADQAQGPFLNPVEQALSAPGDVVALVCSGSYGDLFKAVWGESICDYINTDAAYDAIALSIAAYEGSPEVNAFSSKFDQTFGGKLKLSKEEQRGYALFRGKGKCARCHTANGKEALFTDFTFDNLGLPQNPDNPAGVAPDFVDPGLGGFLQSLQSDGDDEEVYEEEWGKHKVPTLRNVGKGSCEDTQVTNPDAPCIVKAYGHNGYFKSLAAIVHFYNTRDVLPQCQGPYTEAEALDANCWPEPEVADNVNTDELGDLGLSPDEEADIVAFLMTLSDDFSPEEAP